MRRLLLQKLAYLCDYTKGGASVTALALEHRPAGTTFWVAANSCPEGRIVPFLRGLLKKLRDFVGGDLMDGEAVREDILSECVMFARLRFKTYLQFLRKQFECVKGQLKHRVDMDARCMFSFARAVLEEYRTNKNLFASPQSRRCHHGCMIFWRTEINTSTFASSRTNSAAAWKWACWVCYAKNHRTLQTLMHRTSASDG